MRFVGRKYFSSELRTQKKPSIHVTNFFPADFCIIKSPPPKPLLIWDRWAGGGVVISTWVLENFTSPSAFPPGKGLSAILGKGPHIFQRGGGIIMQCAYCRIISYMITSYRLTSHNFRTIQITFILSNESIKTINFKS